MYDSNYGSNGIGGGSGGGGEVVLVLVVALLVIVDVGSNLKERWRG